MKKRTIFDIEKVGFGDELTIKPKALRQIQELDEKQVNPIAKKDISSEIVDKASQVKSYLKEEKLVQPKKILTKDETPTETVAVKNQSHRFKPLEFVSPITGRREKQPKVVQLAHGQYELLSASLVEEIQESVHDGIDDLELDEVMKYENQVMGSIDCGQVEEIEEIFTSKQESLLEKMEVNQGICPCYRVQSHDDSLERNETEVISRPSNEAIADHVVKTNEKTESIIQESPIVIPSDADEIRFELEPTNMGARHTEEEKESSNAFMNREVNDHIQTEEVESDVCETPEDTFEDENFCDEVLTQVNLQEEEVVTYYETPILSLLSEPESNQVADEEWILNKMDTLEQTFNDFGVKVRLTGDYTQGPTVTQIEIQPESGTKVSKILGLYNDLKLNLSVEELRIEPIPGKNTIGVELPNPTRKMVRLKEILSNPEFVLHESPLYIGLGQDIAGDPVYADILTMPHGLIAGQTGSGKSVCINTLLISILYKASPEDVRIMLIDPKRVELAPYNQIPHLVTPVIVDERKAAMGLKWAVEEMERRYELFAQNGVRDIKSFNERRHEFDMAYPKLPYILIVIDELADLMMVSAQEVEEYIMRITQKARAAGIHLIVATQRPTVDVITGTIKSNIPSRIAFAVAQGNDSRVILDEMGAQSLLGRGDMLLSQSGSKLKRVQGAFISSNEIDNVVDFVKTQGKPAYLIPDQVFEKGSNGIKTDSDPLLKDAMRFFFDKGGATASSLQTRLAIGYNRAARIIDTLEMNGWIGQPQSPSKPREILISREEFESMIDETRF